jgi:hypothetical protein
MELLLKRRFKGPKYTIGSLYINKEYFCDTIEDIDRKLNDSMTEEEIKRIKVYGETAIPYGTYKIDMNTVSPKFKDRSWAKPYSGKLPRLLNVKGYEGVLIHVGNTQYDSLGCLICGENKQVGRVINSTATFNKLMNILLKVKLKEEEIEIVIK